MNRRPCPQGNPSLVHLTLYCPASQVERLTGEVCTLQARTQEKHSTETKLTEQKCLDLQQELEEVQGRLSECQDRAQDVTREVRSPGYCYPSHSLCKLFRTVLADPAVPVNTFMPVFKYLYSHLGILYLYEYLHVYAGVFVHL